MLRKVSLLAFEIFSFMRVMTWDEMNSMVETWDGKIGISFPRTFKMQEVVATGGTVPPFTAPNSKLRRTDPQKLWCKWVSHSAALTNELCRLSNHTQKIGIFSPRLVPFLSPITSPSDGSTQSVTLRAHTSIYHATPEVNDGIRFLRASRSPSSAPSQLQLVPARVCTFSSLSWKCENNAR